jgi:hypothetical protein
VTVDDTDKTIAGVAKGVFFVACVGLGFYLRALVLAYGWNRFAVVGLGAAALTMPMAFGLAVLANVFITQPPTKTDEEAKGWQAVVTRAIARLIIAPLASWAMLAIVWEIAN